MGIVAIHMIDVMTNLRIKSSKLNLLKALQEDVDQALENADVNPSFEYDVAEIISTMRDKKTVKRLKVIKKELDKWIEEMEKEPS